MAGRLTTDKKAAVIGALVEGNSIRSTERMTGVHRDTITKLVVKTGRGCDRLMHDQVRRVECDQLELDEVWAFVGKKRNHVRQGDDPEQVGDFWTWVALDPDSKLVPAFHVGKRGMSDAAAFAKVIRQRVEGRVQLNTDKLAAYRSALLGEFSTQDAAGNWIRPDWGTIVKRYEVEPAAEGRYSPPRCVEVKRHVETGNPDVRRISTSHVERSHLTMRMGMRRLTRLTNGFSKKVENLKAAVSLHYGYYNFVRKHSTIKTTPALAAGVADRQWTLGDLVDWGERYGR